MYISISNIGDYDLEYCVSQLENPNSKLNNLGVELCEKIQKKIKKPVYYLQLTDKNAQVCPKCGGILENLPIDINNYSEYCNIDKVCKKCNLVFETNKMEK
jgi:predicted  nucleic acid-binding Zn ribbon protein